jgi:transketolase
MTVTLSKSLLKTHRARMWSKLGQRGTFGTVMLDIGDALEKVVVLTGDLANTSGLDRFSVKYPSRFYNIGIAEQNMVGVAAGMASEGLIPFASTFATFASMRSLEQARVHMGYMKLNVKLVGLASGFAMGQFGNTHYAIEDISIFRAIPNITVLSPADTYEVAKCVEAAALHEGPVYLRLTGVMNNPIVYSEDYPFEIGKAIELKSGSDVSIIATGSMVEPSLRAAEMLNEHSISAGVLNIHTLKPIDKNAVIQATKNALVVTVEEHNIIGGLGSAVSECLSEVGSSSRQLFIGVADRFIAAGNYPYLLQQNGLTATQIAGSILKAMEK